MPTRSGGHFGSCSRRRRRWCAVFDDVQWGDETFLDLVEAIGLTSVGAPILLLCMARPELCRATSFVASAVAACEPLAPEDTEAPIGDAVSEGLRDRIAHTASGSRCSSPRCWRWRDETSTVEVPPSLKALLAMRLDQLHPRRAARARVWCGRRRDLSPRRRAGARHRAIAGDRPLAALVRRQLIRPDRAQLPGENGFRFRHLLIRDAAYDALPKAERAELHRRFADWLEVTGGSWSTSMR